MNTDDLLSRLVEIVGESNLLSNKESLVQYGTDWTRVYDPNPLAIVFIESEQQLLELVAFARANGVGLVPSGGRTGLSAGAVAIKGELVVSFDKYNQIIDFNEVDSTVTLQAGVITANVHAFAEEKGLLYPVDFASAGSSQIGGNIATNAGGIKVLHYGLTRNWVMGLKVVTGAGELLDLNKGLTKNATGYDLRHLFIGSEGTLGFILEATLKLTKRPGNPVAILLCVPSMDRVIKLLLAFRSQIDLLAYEFFSDLALGHVTSRLGIAPPFSESSPYYVLLEYDESNKEVAQRAENAFVESLGNGLVTDGIVSRSEKERKNIWRYREAISEAITPFTPYKNDLSVTIAKIPAFLQQLESIVEDRYPDFEIIWFGHIGDGNLHLNILKPENLSMKQFMENCAEVSIEVAELVADYGGSISAEHGVGLLKKAFLGYTRSDAEIAYLKQIKNIFDPDAIMNPGKLIAD